MWGQSVQYPLPHDINCNEDFKLIQKIFSGDVSGSIREPLRYLRNPEKARRVFTSSDKAAELVEGSVEDPQTLKRAFDGVALFSRFAF